MVRYIMRDSIRRRGRLLRVFEGRLHNLPAFDQRRVGDELIGGTGNYHTDATSWITHSRGLWSPLPQIRTRSRSTVDSTLRTLATSLYISDSVRLCGGQLRKVRFRRQAIRHQ